VFSSGQSVLGSSESSYCVSPDGKVGWNGCYERKVVWNGTEGDVISCLLNFESREIGFQLNGVPLLPGAVFTELPKGSWDEGFHPAATFGAMQGAFFNFGQENWVHDPPGGYVSVLAACKGQLSQNATASEVLSFTTLFWVIYEHAPTGNAVRWRTPLTSDGIQRSEEEIKANFAQVQVNNLRQVSRGLNAIDLEKNPSAFQLAVRLSGSDDLPSRRWALKAVLKAVGESPLMASRVLQEDSLWPVVSSCLGEQPTVQFEEVVQAFCAEKNLPIFMKSLRYFLSPTLESLEDKVVIETEHPYDEFSAEYYSLSLPGAKVMKIMFDTTSRIQENDMLCFWKQDPRIIENNHDDGNVLWGGPFRKDNLPCVSKPLFIPSDNATLEFKTCKGATGWGWRLLAVPAQNAEYVPKVVLFDNHCKNSEAIILQSKHPYEANTTLYETLSFPGAQATAIAFDPKTSTESNHSFLHFYLLDPREYENECPVSEKFSGGLNGSEKNFPGLGALENEPLIISSDSCTLKFESDSSFNNAWGYRLVAWPLYEIEDPLQHFRQMDRSVTVESTHPYSRDYFYFKLVSFWGAKAIKIVFDPRCSTEFDSDYVRLHRLDKSKPFQSDEDILKQTEFGSGKFWGASKYHGRKRDSKHTFLTAETPLIIPDDSFILTFQTSSSVQDWGFRIVAWPVEQSFVLPFEQLSSKQGAIVVESEHPYPLNASLTFTIKIPGAPAFSIFFHHDTSTTDSSAVDIFKEDPSNKSEEELVRMPRWGKTFFGGFSGSESNFPGLCGVPPLRILSDVCYLRLKTAGEPSDWGFRLVASPEADPLQEWGGKYGKKLESSHPYPNNANDYFEISFPGCQGMEVAFDSESSTEKDYAFVAFYSGTIERRGPLVEGTMKKYSGGRGASEKNFPTIDNPLLLPHSAVVLHFESDSSNNDWGWRVVARPVETIPEDPFVAVVADIELKKRKKIIQLFLAKAIFAMSVPQTLRKKAVASYSTPRTLSGTYPPNTKFVQSVTFPGASSLAIKFGLKCHTEYKEDILSFHKDAKTTEPLLINTALHHGNTKIWAQFSGVYSVTEKERGPEETKSSGWPDFVVSNACSLVWRFQSDAVKSFYGADFTVTADYPLIKSVSFEVAAHHLMQKDMFPLILRLALAPTKPETDLTGDDVRVFSGLILSNLLFTTTLESDVFSSMGVLWLKDLLVKGAPEVKLSIVRALIAVYSATEKDHAKTGMAALVNFVTANDLMEEFVILSLDENIEVKQTALIILEECISTSYNGLEAAFKMP